MTFVAPRTVGPWTLVERLGRGGMGEVWRAYAADGRWVALKLMTVSGEGSLPRRFAREARTILELRHPNVVRAVDFGAADAVPWLAMELLEGETLSARLRARHALPVGESVGIARQAAAGLAAAHAVGIVHRDVKPANLFVCKDGTVKVLDFGLALQLEHDAALDGSTRLTETGLVGTPSYMAPEQASGERAEDARTDVWGLGAVLHRCVGGRPPFGAGPYLLGEVFRILDDVPDPLPPFVPDLVRDVVLRALQKDPAARFASMAEMEEALGAVAAAAEAAGAAVAAEVTAEVPPPGSSKRASRASRAAISLGEEERLVSAVLLAGVRDAAALEAFRALARAHDASAVPLAGRRALAVLGGAQWSGAEPVTAVRLALAARGLAARIGVGTGKAVVTRTEAGNVVGAALAAAAVAMASAGRGAPAERDALLAADAGADAPTTAGAAPPVADDPAAGATIGACPVTLRRIAGAFAVDGARVLGARDGFRAAGVREVGGVEVALAGRANELAQLTGAIAQAAAESRAQAVLIVGPAGIGKSRLRYEAQRWAIARGDVAWLEGRGEAARRAATLAPLREALRIRGGLPEGTPAAEARAAVERLVATAALPPAEARGAAEFVGELLDAPFDESDHLRTARADPRIMADRIRQAVGDLLEAWTAAGPLVLAIEDLHWADGATLALLAHLAERLERRPFVLIATARPELLVEAPDLLPRAARIGLRELARDQLGAIVAAILGDASQDAAPIVERAAGNPYFAEELALAVREGAAAGAALPLSVEGALQARLDRLPAAEKDLLKRAAVLGRRFWTEALLALGEEAAPALLATLRQRDLVLPRPDSRLRGCQEWFFRHALVQEVSARLLTDSQRRALHGAAARWLAGRADAAPDEVAEHLEQAGAAAAACGWWQRAALTADRRGDSAQVLALGARALAGGASLDPQDEYDLRLRRSDSLSWLGRYADEEPELAAAEALAGRHPDLLDERLPLRRATNLRFTGRSALAVVETERALALAEQSGPAACARVLAVRTAALVGCGRWQEAEEAAAAAVAWAARGSDRTALAAALGAQFNARTQLPGGARIADIARVAALYGQLGDIRREVNSKVLLGLMLVEHGDHEGAERVLVPAVEATRAMGLRRLHAGALGGLGVARARLGDAAGAAQAATAALESAEQSGLDSVLGAALVRAALVACASGDLAEADRVSARAEDVGGRLPPAEAAHSLALRAMVLAALGRFTAALEASDRALALRGAGALDVLEVELFLARHDALGGLGRAGDAAAALAEAGAALERRLAVIDDPDARRTFVENVPAHRRVRALLAVGPAG